MPHTNHILNQCYENVFVLAYLYPLCIPCVFMNAYICFLHMSVVAQFVIAQFVSGLLRRIIYIVKTCLNR